MRWDPVNLRDPTGRLSQVDSAATAGILAHRPPTSLTLISLGVAGIVLSAGTLAVGEGMVAALLGMSGALGLSTSVASVGVGVATIATGQPEAADQAALPLAYASGIGPMLGGTVGMFVADDPRTGLAVGTGVGAGLEFGAVGGYAAYRGVRGALTFDLDIQFELALDDLPPSMRPDFDLPIPEPLPAERLPDFQGPWRTLPDPDIDWGKYLRKQTGTEPPPGMEQPHAHHAIFKKGRPGRQRLLVEEAHGILQRRAGIDPIFGTANLGWAPNRGHTTAVMEDIVRRLRALDAANAGPAEFERLLADFKREAAAR
jgi:hypothetical protein